MDAFVEALVTTMRCLAACGLGAILGYLLGKIDEVTR